MADDIAQFCQIEIDGVKMVVKGGVEIGLFVGRLLRALFEKGKDAAHAAKEKDLKTPGEKSTLAEIIKLSEGGPPQGIDLREVDAEALLELAEKKGLHYWKAVDFKPNDMLIPIQVPAQEMASWGQLIHMLNERRLKDDTQNVSNYDSKIAELNEKIRNTQPGSEERKELEVQLENLTQSRDEAKKWVEYGEKVKATPEDKLGYSLNEYLYQCKGTDFEKNPEVAMAEMKKGVEISPQISLKESLQPIRDKSFMPDSQLMFYVPEIGAIVTREFFVDDKTGLVYSDYSFKKDNGEIMCFTDHNMTKAQWNEKILPDILQNGGMLEGTMCCAFNSEEKLVNYLDYHGKVENPAKQRVEEKIKNGEPVFSSAETKHEILHALEEQDKGFASAKVDENTFHIMCTPNMFTNQGGKLDFKVSEDEHIQFSAASVSAELGSKGMFKMTINKDSTPVFVKQVGEATTTIPITPKEAKRRMDEVLGADPLTADRTVSQGQTKVTKGR